MIELPRAALMAGDIAQSGEFFSFGTNDLTQTTIGISRDDASRFLTTYVDKGHLLPADPVRQPRCRGVWGNSLRWQQSGAGRRVPDIKLGICGEHGR